MDPTHSYGPAAEVFSRFKALGFPDLATLLGVNRQVRFVGGVLAPDAAGAWGVRSDYDSAAGTGHLPINCGVLAQTDDSLVVSFDPAGAGVITAFALPDEILGRYFSCGPSVASDSMTIKIARTVGVGGYFYYSSGWQALGGVGILAKSWHAGLTSLKITFNAWAAGGTSLVQVSGRDGTYIPQVGANTTNEVYIQFRDFDGVQAAVEDANMKVRLMVPPNGEAVNPVSISSTHFPNGNIWFGALLLAGA